MIAAQSMFSLRRVLIADAIIGVPTGLMMGLAAQPLSGLLNIPANFLFYVGWLLVAIAVGVGVVGTRTSINRAAVWAIIVINTIWVFESFAILALGWIQPNILGTSFVVFQGLVVAALTVLEYRGLRQEQG
jgi:hypothetical protein